MVGGTEDPNYNKVTRNWQCPYCDKVFENNYDYIKHYNIHQLMGQAEYKSADAEIFWQAIGDKGRTMYIKSIKEDLQYVNYRWEDIPRAIRVELSKEMNQHYRKPSLEVGAWRQPEITNKDDTAEAIKFNYTVFRFRTQISMTQKEFEDAMKETNMDSAPFVVMFLDKFGVNAIELAANNFRMMVREVERIWVNRREYKSRYSQLFSKYESRIGKQVIKEDGLTIHDPVEEDSNNLVEVGKTILVQMDEDEETDILMQKKKFGWLASLLIGAAIGGGGYIAAKKVLGQLMSGGVSLSDAYRLLNAVKGMEIDGKKLIYDEKGQIITFLNLAEAQINGNMSQQSDNYNLAKDSYYDDIDVFKVAEEVKHAGGGGMIVKITDNYATVLRDDGSGEYDIVHLKGLMRKDEIIYTEKYGMCKWNGINQIERQKILVAIKAPINYGDKEWNAVPRPLQDVILAKFGRPIEKKTEITKFDPKQQVYMDTDGELVKYPASVLSVWDNYIRSSEGEQAILHYGIEEAFSEFCLKPIIQAALKIKNIPNIRHIMKGHHFTADGTKLSLPAGDYEVIEEKVDFAHSGLWGTFVDVSVRNIRNGKVYVIPKGNAQLMGYIPIGKKKDQYNRKLNRIDSKTGKYERCSHCDSETHHTSEHYDNKQNVDKYWSVKCPDCDYSRNGLGDEQIGFDILEDHFHEHHHDNTDVAYAKINRLRNKMKQEFTCPYCHDKFGDEAEYEDHAQAHKSKDALGYLKAVVDVFKEKATQTCTLCHGKKTINGRQCPRCEGDGVLYDSWEDEQDAKKGIRSDDKNRRDRRNGTNVHVKFNPMDEDLSEGEIEEIYQSMSLKLDRIERHFIQEGKLGDNEAQIRNRISYQKYVDAFAREYDISKDLAVELMTKWGATQLHKARDDSNAGDTGNRDNSHQQGKGDDYQSNVKPSKRKYMVMCVHCHQTFNQQQSTVCPYCGKDNDVYKGDANMSTDTSGVYNPTNQKPKKDRMKAEKEKCPKCGEMKYLTGYGKCQACYAAGKSILNDGRHITYADVQNIKHEVGIMTPNRIQGVTPVYKEEIDITELAGEFYKDVAGEFDKPDKPDKPDKTPKPDKAEKPEKPQKPEKPNGR